MLYIAVYGHVESSFSIKVVSRNDVPSNIAFGIPQYGELAEAQYDYYYALASVEQNLLISLTSIHGDADLLVNIWDSDIAGNRTNWSRPSIEESPYIVMPTIVSERFELDSRHLTSLCPSRVCVAIVGSYL